MHHRRPKLQPQRGCRLCPAHREQNIPQGSLFPAGSFFLYGHWRSAAKGGFKGCCAPCFSEWHTLLPEHGQNGLAVWFQLAQPAGHRPVFPGIPPSVGVDRYWAQGQLGCPDRLALLQRLAGWWPNGEVPLKSFPLVADREFGGEDWLVKLARLGFSFVARLKSNRQLVVWKDGKIREKPVKLRVLRRCLSRKKLKTAEVAIAGEYVCHLVCLPNTGTRDKDPYIYLFTNLDDPGQAGAYYELRWTIESCFKHLKTNGSDLEGQGFRHGHQLEIVMAVLVLLYVLCVVRGVLQHEATLAQKGKPALKNMQTAQATRTGRFSEPDCRG